MVAFINDPEIIECHDRLRAVRDGGGYHFYFFKFTREVADASRETGCGYACQFG